MSRFHRFCAGLAFSLVVPAASTAESTGPRPAAVVGDVEVVYDLPLQNTDVRGLAFDGPQLYALDRSGTIFVYAPPAAPRPGRLTALRSFKIPPSASGASVSDPRGLAIGRSDGRLLFHVLDWSGSGKATRSGLWAFVEGGRTASVIDLASRRFNIGTRELLSITRDQDTLLVSFDSSDYPDQHERVRRGLLRLRWQGGPTGGAEFVKHMPDSGRERSRGLGFMSLDGARYLWSTSGDSAVYVAEAETGRGLFSFDLPRSTTGEGRSGGLAFGNDDLWVAETRSGADRLHRVNVTRTLDAAREGPRMLRHLVMTIQTDPEGPCPDPGKVTHYYSRPYANAQIGSQGTWPETERLTDLTGVANALVKTFTHDPAKDAAARQFMGMVEYPDAPARSYKSKYEIDVWTNPYRKYVYPHRVDTRVEALAGTDYLADDDMLYNLNDRETYDAFFARVKAYIASEYGPPVDMANPYWAVRNILEYIQDHYYYPRPGRGAPAAVDYARKHYDGNPGNLKIDLSRSDYDQSQIIACSGASVMVSGAMRQLGIPARWLGAATPQDPEEWDQNGNGLLDEGETAIATNGHRLNQVWLGSRYGWIEFDATPYTPVNEDYSVRPPAQSQWAFMTRSAGGLRKPKRIILNVGSEFFPPLYREFECNDPALAAINACGGDQRYNLQGRFEKKALWKLAKHRIQAANLCFLDPITLHGPPARTQVSWTAKGAWDRDPEAKLTVFLQQPRAGAEGAADVATLARDVSAKARSVAVDLSRFSGREFRIVIRKVGDPETGGQSAPFDLGGTPSTDGGANAGR
jgi:transglutaminase-like putative cysteine protease